MCIIRAWMQACLFKLINPDRDVCQTSNNPCLDLAHVEVRKLPSWWCHKHALRTLWNVLEVQSAPPTGLTARQPTWGRGYPCLLVVASPSPIVVWSCVDVGGNKLGLL